MNCIWILLLLCCCGKGNNSCGNVCGNEEHNHCDHKHDCDCMRECGERDSNSCERRNEREDRDCPCEDNCSRTERIIPPIRNDFGAYGRNDRYDDNDYSRRSGDYDRRDRRCETCGCEAE